MAMMYAPDYYSHREAGYDINAVAAAAASAANSAPPVNIYFDNLYKTRFGDSLDVTPSYTLPGKDFTTGQSDSQYMFYQGPESLSMQDSPSTGSVDSHGGYEEPIFNQADGAVCISPLMANMPNMNSLSGELEGDNMRDQWTHQRAVSLSPRTFEVDSKIDVGPTSQLHLDGYTNMKNQDSFSSVSSVRSASNSVGPSEGTSSEQVSTGTSKRRRNRSRRNKDEDEQAKRMKLLVRNRIAASKCRQRKKEWIQQLEQDNKKYIDKVERLTHTTAFLTEVITKLKSVLSEHKNCPKFLDSGGVLELLDINLALSGTSAMMAGVNVKTEEDADGKV